MEEDILRLETEIKKYTAILEEYKQYKDKQPPTDEESIVRRRNRDAELKKLKEDLEIEQKKEEEAESSGNEGEPANIEYWRDKLNTFISKKDGAVKYEESCLLRAQENMRQLELSKQAEIKKITDKYDALIDEQYRAIQTVETRLAQSRERLHTGKLSIEKSLKHAERKYKASKSKKSPARIRLETKIANIEKSIATEKHNWEGYSKYQDAVDSVKRLRDALNHRLTQQARNDFYNPPAKPVEPPKPKVMKKYKWVTPIQSQSTGQGECKSNDSGECCNEVVHPSSSVGQTVSDPS